MPLKLVILGPDCPVPYKSRRRRRTEPQHRDLCCISDEANRMIWLHSNGDGKAAEYHYGSRARFAALELNPLSSQDGIKRA